MNHADRTLVIGALSQWSGTVNCDANCGQLALDCQCKVVFFVCVFAVKYMNFETSKCKCVFNKTPSNDISDYLQTKSHEADIQAASSCTKLTSFFKQLQKVR
jgi:hypothetical protein